MRKIYVLVFIVASIAFSLCSQTVKDSDVSQHAVTLDDPLVEVREFTMRPLERTGPHPHPLNEILIFREAGKITRTDLDLRHNVERLDFPANYVRWEPVGAPYTTENTSDHRIDVVEVTLKNTPASPPVALTNLDMLVTDPNHYQWVLENDQVRVLRVRYEPHEKGALHQHVRPRLVVNLGKELRAASGDMYLRKAETHEEQNDADYAVDRIVVELK